MSMGTHLGWWLLALILNFNNAVPTPNQPAQPAMAIQNSSDETAIRTLAEAYFRAWAAKDLDGFLRLWSAQSPELEARRKATTELFAGSEKITLNNFALRRINLKGDKARVRVEVDARVIDAKTGKEKTGYGQMPRTLECVKGPDGWKVVAELSTYDELAGALLTARTDEERVALLRDEAGLAPADISRALVRRSDQLRDEKQYAAALAAARLALKLAEQLDDRAIQGLAWEQAGRAYGVQRDYRQAAEHYQRGLALFEALGDRQMASSLLGRIASCYHYLEDYRAALENNLKRLKLKEELNDREWIAGTLDDLTFTHYRLGNFPAALAAARRAIALYEELGDDHGVARVLTLVGSIQLEQSDYEQAIASYERAGAIFAGNDDAVGSALSTLNIGEVYSGQGDYSRALDAYQKALAVFTREKSPHRMAQAFHDIGTVYSALADHEQARDYFQRSLLLYEQARRPVGIAEALAAYEQSLALYKAVGARHGMAEAHATMGDGYLLLKQPERALASYRESLALFEEIGNKNGVASAMTGIARVEQARDDHVQALSVAEPAAALAGQTGNLELLWEIDSVMGKSRLALKQTEPARRAFERAVAAIELLRSQAAGGELARRYFLEHRLAPYHSLIDLLAGQGQANEALVWAERSKARVLLDALQSGRVDLLRAMTAAEQQQERKQRAEIISLNTRVTRASRQEKPDQAKLDELKSQREKARLNYEAFQTSLYAAHPELRAQRGEAPPIKAEQIAALLPDMKSALLEYVVTDEVTYLFVVTKAAGVQVHTLPVKRDELIEQTETLRQQMSGRDLGFRASTRALYQLLLKPAQTQLRGKTNLVIVPDDKLWELPFQALQAEDGRYVIENSAVSYVPSLTVLREMNAQREKRRTGAAPSALLALGNPAIGRETIERAALTLRDGKLDPLPEAGAVVKALGRLYGAARSKVYVGAEASEDRVKTEAARAGVLHFATHGVLNDAAPMYSHLVLAPGNKNEDGLLEAWELMQLDLRAGLAVLSACETARGRFGAGEGVIGLSWAMFVAGVPAVVVSQWKVESAGTRDLMLSFHRQLQAPRASAKLKGTKAEAL